MASDAPRRLTVRTYDVGFGPHGICFDGDNIWVANLDANSVTKLKASDGSLVGQQAGLQSLQARY